MESIKTVLTDIQNRLQSVEENITSVSKAVTGIKIDNQKKVDRNIDLTPGIGTKVAYDKNGLIIKSDKLEESDIPMLSIDHITGLRTMIEERITHGEVSNMISSIQSADSSADDKSTYTGCKVNYDSNGRVLSSSELLKEDLPELSISDISGLRDELENIKSSMVSTTADESNIVTKPCMIAGTFMKLKVNEYGNVLSGSNTLNEDDLPNALLTRLNTIESNMINFADKKVVNSITTSLSKKIDEPSSPITSGSYTKVTVDSNGLVTSGSTLSKKDLPTLSISDISGLYELLKSKASENDIITINETVNNAIGNITKYTSVIQRVENTIDGLASDEDVLLLKNRVDSIQSVLDKLISVLPVELINTQLSDISDKLNTLEGRVINLENQLLQLQR